MLNPIKRELLRVMRLTQAKVRSSYLPSYKWEERDDMLKYRQIIFRSLLSYIFLLYNSYNKKYYNKNYTFFCLDMIKLYNWLNKQIKSHLSLVYLTIQIYIKRSMFTYFFSGYFKDKFLNLLNFLFDPFLPFTGSNYLINLPPFSYYSEGIFQFIYENFLVNTMFF